MKAFLLAAGLGTRLRPLTDTIPKCLIPIHGKPLMAWWLELLQRNGVDEVLVNTHYLAEQVHLFITEYNNAHNEINVVEAFEPTLLGSGGTIATNRRFVQEEENFLICYADNLTDIDLSKLNEYHNKHMGILTMALFRTNTPKQCGIATLDASGRVLSFIEKPDEPTSNLANAGVYVADRALLDYIPQRKACDLGKDIIPKLVGNMFGFETNDYIIDIGTPENLELARSTWRYDHL